MSKNENFIPISEPYLVGNEARYLQECIESGWISSKGKFIDVFEKSFAKYVNAPYALSTSNGTVALHLALKSIGVGVGDEVIVPDLTFAASVNSILYSGAKPILVDVDIETFNIDEDLIENKISPNTKAIMAVHLYGLPVNMSKIMALAEKYNLMVIEDAAEAFGSVYENRKIGSVGRVACFSFYGNKTITTGEGGMVTFQNESDYKNAKILRDHGMNPDKPYWHDQIGFNYRMTNMQASIGCAQLEKADYIIEKKIRNAWIYKSRLNTIEGISFARESIKSTNTFWLVTIIINKKILGKSSDELRLVLAHKGIDTRPLFNPIHKMPPYKEFAIDLYKNSSYLSENGLSLPSSVNLNDKDIHRICDEILNFFANE